MQTARNGKEAVDSVEHNSFDLILMDMQMPVMDGYTAAGILRERGFEVPIIALTADAMKGTETRCRSAGCTGFLTKPIDMDKLVESLGEILQTEGLQLSPSETRVTLGPRCPTRDRARSTRRCPPTTWSSVRSSPNSKQRLREKLDAMQTALSDHDFDQLAQLAHWLKGSGGTAGFHEFTDLAKELEQLAREGAADAEQIIEPF